jgi:aryl-alcohol dehydrogenase
VQTAPLVIEPNLLAAGRNIMGILEGDAVPQVFIPQLIDLWRQGRFPFDRLVQTFPFAEIDRAEQSSLSGEVVKPVLLAPA